MLTSPNHTVQMSRLSWAKRLSLVLSACWLLYVFVDVLDSHDYFTGRSVADILTRGAVPLLFIWGIWWVVSGFRQRRRHSQQGRPETEATAKYEHASEVLGRPSPKRLSIKALGTATFYWLFVAVLIVYSGDLLVDNEIPLLSIPVYLFLLFYCMYGGVQSVRNLYYRPQASEISDIRSALEVCASSYEFMYEQFGRSKREAELKRLAELLRGNRPTAKDDVYTVSARASLYTDLGKLNTYLRELRVIGPSQDIRQFITASILEAIRRVANDRLDIALFLERLDSQARISRVRYSGKQSRTIR